MTTDGELASSHPGDEHETPELYGIPFYCVQAHTSALTTLKARIAQHYDLASTYYYSLWGQHIHHGLFTNGATTKEAAQGNLIDFMLEFSEFPKSGATVLDVGCGLGGTCRYLAQRRGSTVTGITISEQQIGLARKITGQDAAAEEPQSSNGDFTSKGSTMNGSIDETPAPVSQDALASTPFLHYGSEGGQVRFLHLDAEQMSKHLPPATYTHVWVTEALSHIPNKALFFKSAFDLLKPATSAQPSRLIIADWFRGPPESFTLADDAAASSLTPAQLSTVAQIEDGMLLPELPSVQSYIAHALAAGFTLMRAPPPSTHLTSFTSTDNYTATLQNPIDISPHVAATWDISWSLVSSPSLWAYAISQGRDGLSFLQSFRAMRRGYKEGSLRYGVVVFEKPVAEA
ncbi:putative tocopherol O-methyltransferase, chloroplastic [Cyphellophora attinorum]|uniref:Putative tocopherol O-methyltransferase, chloroplastic n=1 Tax=Cyphellophora attinorum TaxID=1664694 RepID=A0A0N0NKP8_9EURO|nr:putative tocopherol O-methyltransferase, chloroplastic [Phialophora attinorum]KPI38401.1 putative tocopherol O-methyltransferase, chloroplastic [Phialophora attinorum]